MMSTEAASVVKVGQDAFVEEPVRWPSSVTFALVIANMGALYFYFVHDFTLFQLVFVFWCEAVWIGIFGALQLLVSSVIGRPYDTERIGVSPGASLFISFVALSFFGAKYLGFLGFAAIAIVAAATNFGGADLYDVLRESGTAVILSSSFLILGHGLSFVVNFLVRGEYRNTRPMRLIFAPYLRCVPLLLAIVGIFVIAIKYPDIVSKTGIAVVIVAFKLGMDLLLYSIERRRNS